MRVRYSYGLGRAFVMVMAVAAILPVPLLAHRGLDHIELAAGGSDIIRIVPDDTPRPGRRDPPVNPPASVRPPETPKPPATPPNVAAGKLLKVPVRLGTLASDNRKAWLGVNMEVNALDRSFVISIGLREPRGALLLETTPGGPAATAGLRTGDIVLTISGVTIANSDALRQRIAQETPNSQVMVEVWRFVPEDRDYVGTLRKMADEGNAAIMAMLGSMYAAGRSVTRDDGEAANWFRRGASVGHATSMVEFAQMLIAGRGVEKNAQEGIRWLRSAADTGSVYGMWRYGLELLDGRLTSKDLTTAAQLFQRGAEAGYSPAMYDLALMHANGTGVPRNYVEAVRWYQKAVDLNNSAAMVNLGLLYDEGKGVEKNDLKAADLYQRAAQLGHVNGLHNWGVMLDTGRGVPQRDPEQAADLVLQAMERGGEFSYRQMTQNHGAYSREFRMAMQRRLRDQGLYTGAIDGDFGQSTQAAVTAYFKRSQQ